MAEITSISPQAAKALGDAIADALINKSLGGTGFNGSVAKAWAMTSGDTTHTVQRLDTLISKLGEAVDALHELAEKSS